VLFVGNGITTYNLFQRQQLNYLEAFHVDKSPLYLQITHSSFHIIASDLFEGFSRIRQFRITINTISGGKAAISIAWPHLQQT